MLLIIHFILSVLLGFTTALHTLNLNSDGNIGSWTVTNENKTISVSASVPGGIYTDLRKSLILPEDIYHRSNDELYRWVAHDNWTYSLNFALPGDWVPDSKEVLIFHGIDTVAWISLNDVLLQPKLDNMFVRHVLNISGILKYNGLENNLKVKLISPLWEVKERARLWPRVVPDCVPSAYHGECHANLLRKTQSSFSWDWGPAFPSMGIWKDVEIVTYNGAILRDVTVQVNKVVNESTIRGSFWKASFTLHLEAFTPGGMIEGLGQVVLGLKDPSKNGKGPLSTESQIVGEKEVKSGVADENGDFKLVIQLNVLEEQVSLWWPNGLGSQPLYSVIATFEAKGNNYTEKTYKTMRIGFRSVELIQDKIGETGLSFYLKVNGIPVFAKGSNWIPPYSLPEWSITIDGKNMIRHLLLSSKEVSINMLRVWGGGNYETDFFYELADELGILIWQDMMFACSMYPVVPEFLNSTTKEVKQQVSRLQHHPSIVIWAGNNENEAALRQNWYGTALNYSSYLHDYALLYGDIIKTAVMSIDPGAIYLTSSPSNGKESMAADGYVAKNPQSNLYGDIHYYNYLANTWNPLVYPLPRFASEYGFQSLPSLETFMGAGATDEDWGISSDFFIRRQHHPEGYEELKLGIGRHFDLPSNIESEKGMAHFIYLTQIFQAMSLKVETEGYRRGKGRKEPLGNGEIEGMTMGALYWQLNDIWQAPSWSSIEYGGKWKMAHYYSKGFFSNILVSPTVTLDNQLKIYIVSDIPFPCEGNKVNCFLVVRTYSWNNPCPLGITSTELTADQLPADLVYTFDLQAYLESSGCKGGDIDTLKKSCFLTFELNFHSDEYEPAKNFLLLSSPKDAINMTKPNITATSISGTYPTKDPYLRGHYPYSVDITLSSDGISPFVWLDLFSNEGRFSENGFLILATEADPICRKMAFEKIQFVDITSRTSLLTTDDTLVLKESDFQSHFLAELSPKIIQELQGNGGENNNDGHTPSKIKDHRIKDNVCSYNCSNMDNSLRMAICCAEISQIDGLSSKNFSYNVTFYAVGENVNSSDLYEKLTITYPFNLLD